MSIPGDFGRDFRRALFARTTSRGASRLGAVLVDEAYTQRSTVVDAGYRYLRDETGIRDGRNFVRIRDELVDAGLLECRTFGTGRKSRTEWNLLLPTNDRRTADVSNDRRTADVSEDENDRRNDRRNDRPNDRRNDRRTTHTIRSVPFLTSIPTSEVDEEGTKKAATSTPAQTPEEVAGNGRAELPDHVYEWMHKRGVLPSKVLCPVCGQKCGSPAGLASHTRSQHPDSAAVSS